MATSAALEGHRDEIGDRFAEENDHPNAHGKPEKLVSVIPHRKLQKGVPLLQPPGFATTRLAP